MKPDDYGLLKVMSPSIKGRISYDDNGFKKNKALTLDDLKHPKSEKLLYGMCRFT